MRWCLAVAGLLAACEEHGSSPPPDAGVPVVVDCTAEGKPPTTMSGRVFAPNGTLPLFGVTVHVPVGEPEPIVEGPQCSRCGDLPGGAIAGATSDDLGRFTLIGVPAGDNVRVVVSSGKWRRVITVPHVEPCTDTPLSPDDTRLPRTQAEGNVPRIAVTTGDHDAVECLLRKLGLEGEMTAAGGPGRIQLFAGDGADRFAGAALPPAQSLWNSLGTLLPHDLVMLSCEGSQLGTPKAQAALDALKTYADVGGRVYLSHWHNIWVGGNFGDTGGPGATGVVQPAWSSIATWHRDDGDPGDPMVIDESSNPFGTAFANWLLGSGGSSMRGRLSQDAARRHHTAPMLDPIRAMRYVGVDGTQGATAFQFSTPQEASFDQRCGKVTFTDIHMSADSSSPSGSEFPSGCSSGPLTSQEKALAFMFFDLIACTPNLTIPF